MGTALRALAFWLFAASSTRAGFGTLSRVASLPRAKFAIAPNLDATLPDAPCDAVLSGIASVGQPAGLEATVYLPLHAQ